MIKSALPHTLIDAYEFVPQAIIDEPVADLAKRSGLKIEEGHDRFDAYVGSAGWLDNVPFVLMHYSGHPEDTTTLYLPFEVNVVAEISDIISRLALELKFDQLILWQRQDGLLPNETVTSTKKGTVPSTKKDKVTLTKTKEATPKGSNFWVIGGEFGSMNFHKLVEGSAQVQGPFKTRKEAEDAWKTVSEENRHRGGVRFSIVEDPTSDRARKNS